MIKRVLCHLMLMACAFVLALAALFTFTLWNHDGNLDAMVLTLLFATVSLCSATGSVFVLSQD